jgi:putative oxidoreductase
VVAGSVHWTKGLWAQNGGYELSLVYVTAATALAFTGPGAYSLDNALGLDGLAGRGPGVAAVVAGALSGLVVILRAGRAAAVDAVPEAVIGGRIPA